MDKADILCIPHQQYREARGRNEELGIKPGTWSFRLHAVSLAGNGPWTEVQQFYVAAIEMPPPLLSLSLIACLAVAMFVSIIVVSVIVAFLVKKKMNRGMTERDLQSVTHNPNYTIPEKEYVPDKWEDHPGTGSRVVWNGLRGNCNGTHGRRFGHQVTATESICDPFNANLLRAFNPPGRREFGFFRLFARTTT